MPRLALVLVVHLAASPAAHAVPITGRAIGTITLNGSHPSGYQFTPGEAVSVEFVYDPARTSPLGGNPPTQVSYGLADGSFRVTTGSGFTSSHPGNRGPYSGAASVSNGPTDRVAFALGTGEPGIDLTFTDPTGTALSSTALPTLAELLRFTGGTLDHLPGDRGPGGGLPRPRALDDGPGGDRGGPAGPGGDASQAGRLTRRALDLGQRERPGDEPGRRRFEAGRGGSAGGADDLPRFGRFWDGQLEVMGPPGPRPR